MLISKDIILPEWESIEDLEQASNILHKITEALKDHNLQNYDDSVANFQRVTTGRIQSKDGQTYFDLDTGVIRGEIVFRPGSSGLGNVEEANVGDWDNAFKLANAVKGNEDFTLIHGGKILTNSIVVGGLNSDVITRLFSDGDAKVNIEAWMKSGATTYIDGNKIYTGSIVAQSIATGAVTAIKISVTSLAAISAILGSVTAGNIRTTRFQVGGGTDEDIYFEDSGIRLYDAGSNTLAFYKSGSAYLTFSLLSDATCLFSSGSYFQIYSTNRNWYFYDTGHLKLPNVGSQPSHSGKAGSLIYGNDWMHVVSDLEAIFRLDVTSGW